MDVYRLQHHLNYSVYRLNIGTNREVLDWRGVNTNAAMSPLQPGWLPLHSVRSMRKLEYLLPGTAASEYPTLFRK